MQENPPNDPLNDANTAGRDVFQVVAAVEVVILILFLLGCAGSLIGGFITGNWPMWGVFAILSCIFGFGSMLCLAVLRLISYVIGFVRMFQLLDYMKDMMQRMLQVFRGQGQ